MGDRPAVLYWLATDVLAAGGTASGYVFADVYDPAAPNGYYFGFAPWSKSGSGWNFVELSDLDLTWYYVENGTSTPMNVPAQMTREFSGPDSTAWVGITAGCNNAATFFDQFNAADNESDITYDFEGTPTDTDIHRYVPSTQNLVRIDKPYTTTIQAGARPWVAGDHWDRGDDQVGYNNDDNLLGFTGRLYQRVYPSTVFKATTITSTANSSNDYWAWFHLAPARRTTYQIRYGVSSAYEASTSQTMTYNVRRGLSLQIVDKSLVAGQTMVARGQIRPGDKGVKLYVQRYLNGAWRNLRSGYSGTGGDYRLAYTVKSAGTWRVRVLAVTAKGVLANHSQDRYVTVKPKPRKPAPPPNNDSTGSYTYVPPTTTTQPTAPKPGVHLG